MESGDLNYYAFRLAGAVMPWIPPRLGYWLAERLGGIVCRVSALRGNVADNISHITGIPADSPRVRAIARQVYRNQLKNYFDLLRLPALTPEDVRTAVRGVVGIENLDRALAKGQGVVLVSGHFGNFDFAGQILAIRGYTVTSVAERLHPERLFQYVCRIRESQGLRFIPADSLMRPIFRALRANTIVGLALDRNVTDEGQEALFFGKKVRVPDGYLRLALHTNAAVVLAFCHRLPDNTFLIQIEPELELERTGDMEEDIAVNLPRALAIFEGYLRAHPEQWVYFQRFWPLPEATPCRETITGEALPSETESV